LLGAQILFQSVRLSRDPDFRRKLPTCSLQTKLKGKRLRIQLDNSAIELTVGDITAMETDAIVNAANEHLAHGGGVAGVIVRKGGHRIQEESDMWVRQHGLVKTGTAAITSGGSLKAKYVIHAVGPIMGSGDEDAKLRSATLSALQLADEQGLTSIAFPAISTGIFGYPMDRCAKVMLDAVRSHLAGETTLRKVIFCLWDNKAFDVFASELGRIQ